MAITKIQRRKRIHNRIRKIVSGTAETPRMNVFRSNKHIYVQLIDDLNSVTLASVSSSSKELAEEIKGKCATDVSKIVGTKIAKLALEKNISAVKFDRGGYLYHGRVKSLADAAREGGLKF